MKYRLIFLSLIVSFVIQCRADYMVTFTPVDSITRITLPKCEILAFLPGDSVVVNEGYFIDMQRQGDIKSQKKGMIYLPEKNVDYHVIIDAEGYNTRLLPINIPTTIGEFQIYDVGEVGVQRTPKQLNEVTVTATKIKMYYKGDTLVYNADAFLLPDGSMLDDLIRKLDGVSIDRDGVIWCKGRRVNSLQLEGRRLFDDSPKTLLENLGAYTVNKIKVYDETSERERFLGYSDAPKEEKPLVMDVILKKEYSIGKWINIDAGYGSSNRYLGRAFLLGFSPQWAISAFFNANNLSSRSDPGQYSSWKMDDTGSSEASYLSGGLSYQNDWRNGNRTRKIRGSVDVHSSDETTRTGIERVNYLSTGDTYESKYHIGEERNFRVGTSHTLEMNPSNTVFFSIAPSFNYSKQSSSGKSVSATMDCYMEDLSIADIENIYSSDEGEIISHLINRSINQDKSNGNHLNANLATSATIKFPIFANGIANHNLSLSAQGNYSNHHNTSFNRYQINIGTNPASANDIYAYTNRNPNYDGNVNAYASYNLNVKGQYNSSIKYQFKYDQNRNDLSRYFLNELAASEIDQLQFGQLPENTSSLEDVLDLQNSNSTRIRDSEHGVYLSTNGTIGQRDFDKGGHGAIYYAINPSLRIQNRNLNYIKHDYDTTAVRNFVLPAIDGVLNLFADQSKRENYFSLSMRWVSNPTYFAMQNLINVTNDEDPLYIRRGNSHLRNGYSHTGSAQFQYRHSGQIKHLHYIKYEYNFVNDAITNGTIYNPNTGVRISSFYNVNGYWNQTLTLHTEGPMVQWAGGKTANLRYDITLKGNNRRSVDMFTPYNGTAIAEPQQTFVYNRNINPYAKITLGLNNYAHNISFTLNANLRHFTGDVDYYTPFTATDISYNISGSFTLPKNIYISSSFNINTRHGYNDPNLNKTEYIWNASASWNWKKPGLTFTLDAYDILHQRNNVHYYADNMGRTESWSNTINSYILLRIRYHLNLTPK